MRCHSFTMLVVFLLILIGVPQRAIAQYDPDVVGESQDFEVWHLSNGEVAYASAGHWFGGACAVSGLYAVVRFWGSLLPGGWSWWIAGCTVYAFYSWTSPYVSSYYGYLESLSYQYYGNGYELWVQVTFY